MVKERITITIDKILLKWLDVQVRKHTFASRSHGIELLISKKYLKEKNKNAQKK